MVINKVLSSPKNPITDRSYWEEQISPGTISTIHSTVDVSPINPRIEVSGGSSGAQYIDPITLWISCGGHAVYLLPVIIWGLGQCLFVIFH